MVDHTVGQPLPRVSNAACQLYACSRLHAFTFVPLGNQSPPLPSFPRAAYSKDTMHRLLPWLSSTEIDGTFTTGVLRQCVRDAFHHPAPPVDSQSELLDRAFTSLRILGEQIHMARCSSTETTHALRVDVTTAFVGVCVPFFLPENAIFYLQIVCCPKAVYFGWLSCNADSS